MAQSVKTGDLPIATQVTGITHLVGAEGQVPDGTKRYPVPLLQDFIQNTARIFSVFRPPLNTLFKLDTPGLLIIDDVYFHDTPTVQTLQATLLQQVNNNIDIAGNQDLVSITFNALQYVGVNNSDLVAEIKIGVGNNAAYLPNLTTINFSNLIAIRGLQSTLSINQSPLLNSLIISSLTSVKLLSIQDTPSLNFIMPTSLVDVSNITINNTASTSLNFSNITTTLTDVRVVYNTNLTTINLSNTNITVNSWSITSNPNLTSISLPNSLIPPLSHICYQCTGECVKC